MTRKFLAFVASVLLVVGLSAPASAGTSPHFLNNFRFSVNLAGSTKFTTPSPGVSAYVQVDPSGSYTNNRIRVRVEVQNCGFWGCNWNGTYVGGSCYVYPSRTLTKGKTCTFNVPASGELHRLRFTKANDGVYYSGHVDVK
jgi:hypothetical protein